MKLPIGIKFVLQHLPETWKESHPIFIFDIMGISTELERITFSLNFEKLKSSYFGDQLELENHIVHGLKLVNSHTVRIRAQNSGAAMTLSKMLLSMNFVEQSIFPTYYDGSTSILSEWKPKVQQGHFWQVVSGLPPTYTHLTGFHNSTETPSERSIDD